MNVLLRDADDQNLRLVTCREVYVLSTAPALVFAANASFPEQGLDHLIPLEVRPDGLYLVSIDGLTSKNVNVVIQELYKNGKIDLTDYNSYYSGDDRYIDLIVGDTSDPMIGDDDDSDED